MSVTAPFLGLRGTSDFEGNQIPKNYREMILKLFPNGSAVLTGMMSKLKSEVTTSNTFNWYTQKMADMGGTMTAIYTDPGLSSAYASGGIAGDTLYVKMGVTVSEDVANANEFKKGHTVILRDASDPDVDCAALVVAQPVINGASSYVTVQLLEADDNSTSHDLSDADTIYITGSAYGEGGMPPEAINYVPTSYYNYTQIFKTVIELTRTAMKTKLRTTEDLLRDERKEKLLHHGIEMEKALIWGVRTYTANDPVTGKPRTTTMGIKEFIRSGASTHFFNYVTDTNYAGQTWLEGGEDWLDTSIAQVFLWGDSAERLGVIGNLGANAINKLAKANGTIEMGKVQAVAYGLRVREWYIAEGTVYLMRHPLFNKMTSMRRTLLLLLPENMMFRPLTDSDTKRTDVTPKGFDGIKEQYLTEAGFEFHHPEQFAWLDGLGSANAV